MRALILAAALLTAACNDGSSSDDKTDDTTTDDTELTRAEIIAGLTGDTTAGATVYDENCALCHAANGTGGVGPDISDPSGYNEADLIDLLLEGEGTMPSFDALANDELADVVAYVLAGIGG